MTQVTVNGNTYSDDGSSAKDMLLGGFRTHLLPMISDGVTDLAAKQAAAAASVVAAEAAGDAAVVDLNAAGAIITAAADASADAAAASAIAADASADASLASANASAASAIEASSAAAGIRSTSTTSITLGTGSKVFTTQSGKQYSAGAYVMIASAANVNNYMTGQVTAYATTTLTVDVIDSNGTGTFADWNISISGVRGSDGPLGMSSVIRETATATASQTVFDLTNFYTVGTNGLWVYINGVRQFPGTYTETDTNTVTFSTGLTAGDVVLFEIGIQTEGTTAPAVGVSFSATGSIPQTNVQDAIVAVEAAKQATLVSGTNIKTVNGTTLLGSGDVTISSGIDSVTNIVAATTLTAANIAYHTVAMTALGQSVTLPVATTLTVGTPKAVFKNTGGYPFGIRDSAGTLLMGVAAGGVAYVSLDSVGTAAGSWSITGTNLEPGLTTIDTTFSSTYASTVLAPFVALDDNVSIHFAALASGFAAFVVDKVGGVVSTPVTVSATASSVPVQCFKVSSTSAILFFGSSTTDNRAVVLTLNGSTPSYSLSVGSNVTIGGTMAAIWDGENFVGAPKMVQLSSSLYLVTFTDGGLAYGRAMSVSGATITLGTAAPSATATVIAGSTTTYALTATTALVLYKSGGAAPYANNAVVISVSGTTCTVGTPAAVSSVNSSLTSAPISCLLSATKCLVADDNNTTVGNVNVVTISGTTVTAGTVVQFESGLTWTSGYTANSATRYNPHLFPLTSSTALLWYFDSSSVSRCVVLSESGGTVTKGTIVYRSVSGGPSDSPGLVCPQASGDFYALKRIGSSSNAFVVRVAPHKISGTALSVGAAGVLDIASTYQGGMAFAQIPIGRLPSGDYVGGIGGNDENVSAAVPVFRGNGDAVNVRGYVAIPPLAGAGTGAPVPVVSASRIVLIGSTRPTSTTIDATTHQLRLLNIEIAQ